MAACDAHHGHLAHRRAFVDDAPTGGRLVTGLSHGGWVCGADVVMVLRGAPDRVADTAAVRDADEAAFAAVERATDVELQPGVDVGDLGTARAATRAAAARTHRLVARGRDGADAAHATVFSDGRTAQIEDVVTLRAHRGRGLARALVAAACGLVADHQLVFLCAGAEDWPRELYAKLGFEVVGGGWELVRPPGPPA